MSRQLHVWLLNKPVGLLAQEQGKLQFTYRTDWLSDPGACPLSQSLPLTTEAFGDNVTRAYFAGLLPEGRNLQIVARFLQVSRQNDFAILDGIGGECAGAVSLRATDTGTQISNVRPVQWLTDDELYDVIAELPERPMLVGKDGLRLSLAGAQDKLPVLVKGNQLGLPQDSRPSSHILKPSINGIEGSVQNEGFCLQLAGKMSIPTTRVEVRTVREKAFLIVERYDRTTNASGELIRTHQEDFCQALGVVPEYKYQNEGGPSIADCFALIRRVMRPSVSEILRLLDYVIFNTLVGNHDAHGKNFSIHYIGGKPRLAPLYDVLCTAIYPKLTEKMAMKIGSKYKFTEVESRHWDQLSEAAGLSPAQVRRRIQQIANTLPEKAKELRESFRVSEADHPILDEVVRCIEQRCSLTLRRLGG